MLAHRRYKVIIDADRNIIVGKSLFPARAIIALMGIKDVRFYLCRQRRSNRIALLEKRAMQTFKGIFSHLSVSATNEYLIVSLGQFYLFTCLIFDRRKLQISVINHRKD